MNEEGDFDPDKIFENLNEIGGLLEKILQDFLYNLIQTRFVRGKTKYIQDDP